MTNQIKDLSNFSDMELLNELEKRGHYIEDTPSVIDVEVAMSYHKIGYNELTFNQKNEILMTAVKKSKISKTDVFDEMSIELENWISYIKN
jgi:hypothetical protein